MSKPSVPPTGPLAAAVYARKSKEDAESVDEQIGRARAHAAQHGSLVVPEHVYQDDGISGAEFGRRPASERPDPGRRPSTPKQPRGGGADEQA
jgi:hypothetical protein